MLSRSGFFKLLLVTILFTVMSCTDNGTEKHEPEQYGSIFKEVVISEEGIFRTFTLGNAINEVLEKETAKPQEQDINYLYYEYKIDSNVTYNIKYTFDERGLNEIESDIFITNNAELADETFAKFKKYFDDHYGESQTQRGFNIWPVKSDEYGEVMIDLGNESPAFDSKNGVSKISLWIYPNNN
jgi:hypothetical protein